MRSGRALTRPLAFLLNATDRFGRTIEPCVLTIAQEIAPRAVPYGERLLGDPALSMTLFEEAAARVSNAVRQKAARGLPEIREMRRYLFRAYLRRIGDQGWHTPFRVHKMQPAGIERPHDYESRKLERRILLRELLDSCDRLTKEIFHSRLQGCSWKEIEETCGIPANAASLRFSKALRQFQKYLSEVRGASDSATDIEDSKEKSPDLSNRGDSTSEFERKLRQRFFES